MENEDKARLPKRIWKGTGHLEDMGYRVHLVMERAACCEFDLPTQQPDTDEDSATVTEEQSRGMGFRSCNAW